MGIENMGISRTQESKRTTRDGCDLSNYPERVKHREYLSGSHGYARLFPIHTKRDMRPEVEIFSEQW